MPDHQGSSLFVPTVEFICTGNICRSPFAAAAAVALGMPEQAVHSSGVAADSGRTCPAPARTAALHFQLDLGGHRARPTEESELSQRHWVIAMEYGQLREVHTRLPRAWAGRTALLGEFLPGAGVEIPDPFGLREEAYVRIYRAVYRAVGHWAQQVLGPQPGAGGGG